MPKRNTKFTVTSSDTYESETRRVTVIVEGDLNQFLQSDLCAKSGAFLSLPELLIRETRKVTLSYIEDGTTFMKKAIGLVKKTSKVPTSSQSTPQKAHYTTRQSLETRGKPTLTTDRTTPSPTNSNPTDRLPQAASIGSSSLSLQSSSVAEPCGMQDKTSPVRDGSSS